MGGIKDHGVISRMVIGALPRGMTRLSMSRFEWDVSGNCEKAVTVEMTGRPAADWLARLRYVTIARGTQTSLIVELRTPCRKCRVCLRRRMKMWAARAMHEVRQANRTWFATFTLTPAAHYNMQCRAIAHAESRAIPTAELTSEDLFTRQSGEVEKELTLWFKRLRKNVPSHGIRYLLVRERHKSGLPHWHALIHECGEVPISYRMLDTWPHGHAKYKLMQDERAAFYVAKYLGKSHDGRVRASVRYGQFNSDRETTSVIEDAKRRRGMEASEAKPKTSHKKEDEQLENQMSPLIGLDQKVYDLCEQETT
jgi:hypothetical protein